MSIPKIIHYCWFGPKPFSRTVRKCLKTWRKHLSDYEFCFWNEQTCATYAAEHHLPNPMEHPFVQSAYRVRKYAFVADYVRFWALYHIGGIYLDTDVMVLKNFDNLLVEDKFFSGFEKIPSIKSIGAGVMGTPMGCDVIQEVLDRYDTMQFEMSNQTNLVIPRVITPILQKYHNIMIYPYDYFYPMAFEERYTKHPEKYATENTYAIHLYDFSWIPWYSRIQRFIINYTKSLKLCLLQQKKD